MGRARSAARFCAQYDRAENRRPAAGRVEHTKIRTVERLVTLSDRRLEHLEQFKQIFGQLAPTTTQFSRLKARVVEAQFRRRAVADGDKAHANAQALYDRARNRWPA